MQCPRRMATMASISFVGQWGRNLPTLREPGYRGRCRYCGTPLTVPRPPVPRAPEPTTKTDPQPRIRPLNPPQIPSSPAGSDQINNPMAFTGFIFGIGSSVSTEGVPPVVERCGGPPGDFHAAPGRYPVPGSRISGGTIDAVRRHPAARMQRHGGPVIFGPMRPDAMGRPRSTGPAPARPPLFGATP
jgi:hypothetical protein